MTWALRNAIPIIVLAVAATRIAAVPPQTPAVSPAPVAPAATTMSLAALKQVEPGLWQLDVAGRAKRQMCVADPIALVQIEHEQTGCSRFVVANEPSKATVHYACQGAGWGRTTVRVESGTQAFIQTQGISRNAPFDYSVEARRLGSCGAQATAKPR